jgi:predicted amidohydrolase
MESIVIALAQPVSPTLTPIVKSETKPVMSGVSILSKILSLSLVLTRRMESTATKAASVVPTMSRNLTVGSKPESKAESKAESAESRADQSLVPEMEQRMEPEMEQRMEQSSGSETEQQSSVPESCEGAEDRF